MITLTNRTIVPRVRHMAIEFILFLNYISEKSERQLLLSKSNWYKFLGSPVTESAVGSREDPAVNVGKRIDPKTVDA